MKIKLIIILASLFFIHSCKKKSLSDLYYNENYYEVIKSFKKSKTLNYSDSLLLYDSYKQVFNKAFNWNGAVNILTEKEVITLIPDFHELLSEFEVLSKNSKQYGILAGIKFRTGKFEQAYNLYTKIFYSPSNYPGIIHDIEASLSGILLGEDFDSTKDRNLYYETEKTLSKIENFDSLSFEKKEYIESFLKFEKNSSLILSMLQNKETLESLIKKYKLSEDNLTELYNRAIENKNFSKAVITSYQLDKEYQQFIEFEKIWSSYKLGLFEDVLSQSKVISFNDDLNEISNLINIFVIYSKVKTKNFSGILKLYLDTEKFLLIKNDFLKNDSKLSNIDRDYPILTNEIVVIRKLIESLICSSIIKEREVLNFINNSNSNNTILYEMLLKKYLIIGEYYKAYKISKNMYNGINYGILYKKKEFIKIYEMLEIINKRKYNNFLQKKKKEFINRIELNSYDLLQKYKSYIDSYEDAEYFEKNLSYQLNVVYSSINVLSNNYSNIFDVIDSNKQLYYKKIALISGVKNQLPVGYYIRNTESVFMNNIPIPTSFIDKKIVSNFLRPNKKNKLSKIHYNLILLNLVLELEKGGCSDDFIFFYFSSLYNNSNLISYHDSNDFSKLFLNFNERKQMVLNQIFVKVESDLQREYYTLLKEKIKSVTFINNDKSKIEF